MKSFRYTCDPNARPFCSTRIIVDSLNNAAKKIGLYSDEYRISYDCLGQRWENPHAVMVAYELAFPKPVLNNLNGLPILGLSKENAWLAVEGGYERDKVDYVSLGVDKNIWTPQRKKYNKNKFVFVCMCESTVRSNLDLVISAFALAFSGQKGVELYIKDREPTETFKSYVKEKAAFFDIQITHDIRHTTDHAEEKKIFAGADAAICLNAAHTWALTRVQAMSCGLPLITVRYSGASDYLNPEFNGLAVNFALEEVTNAILTEATNIGLKNFLFPITIENYAVQPFWAVADVNDAAECMQRLIDDVALRDKLGSNASCIGDWFSWERAAINTSGVLERFYND